MTPKYCGILSRVGAPALLATLLLTGSTATADILIDDFSSVGSPDPWPAFQDMIGNNLITEIGISNVIGGVRQATIFGDAFQSEGDLITVEIDPLTGLLTYNSTTGADGALSLFYTGFPSGLNQDFTNETGIMIDFASHDVGGALGDGKFESSVTVVINDGSIDVARTVFLGGSGGQLLFFDFNLFAGIGSFDLTSINRISVSIDTFSDVDFSISEIFTVTVPAPGALSIFGLALFGKRRRRRL